MATQLTAHRRPADAGHRRSFDFVDRYRRAHLPAPTMQETLDRITYLAGETLDVPAVCAVVVDPERRLVTSSYGLPVPTALLVSHAFRKQVLASRRPLVVADGRRDPLVALNPAVRDGTVRACVGLPLGSRDGRMVGTLLAMDRRPRRWTALQLDLLGKLSSLVVNVLELGAAIRCAARFDGGNEIEPLKWRIVQELSDD
jgi:GAF domain-containing protein